MYPIAKVREKLLDPNRYVRQLAFRCLAEASDPGSVTADDLWRTFDQYADIPYSWLKDFPQTDSSLQRTLQAIRQADDEDDRLILSHVIDSLSYGLLMRFRDEIEATEGLPEASRRTIARRVELGMLTPSQLWDELTALAAKLDDEDPASDPADGDVLIDALARSPEPGVWAIGELSRQQTMTWLMIFAVRLLGKMKHRGAVELICKAMTSDTESDFLIDAGSLALGNIGTPQVVESLQLMFQAQPELRFHVADTLGRIKLPQSEQAIRACMSKTTERDHRTNLAAALCALPADEPESLEIIRSMINQQKWDVTLLELDEDAYGLFRMIGHEIPELPRWEAALADEAARRSAIRKGHSKQMRQFGNISKMVEKLSIDDDDDDADVWPMDDDEPPTPVLAGPAPIRRTAPKVGRNDPCPCGSGKKYKKCCGK